MKQRQFLQVLGEDEARRRFDDACAALVPRAEIVSLDAALGRVLFEEVRAAVDVPGFDRSNVDGFAVRAEDTFGATELKPVLLRVSAQAIHAGRAAPGAEHEVGPREATIIATGAAIPRGADSVVMVEDTAQDEQTGKLHVFRALAPGAHVTAAGTDLARGEVVLRRGIQLGSRETALLAAVGTGEVQVFAHPRVAVLSTGDEIRAPGETLELGEVHDSNGRALCDAVTELGGEATHLGILPDEEAALEAAMERGLREADVVLLSGGTSKGAGDLNYHVVERLAARTPGSRGILVHGVALKPGKPLCLADVGGKPVVILPGFPTSALFTFHEFVAPLIRRLAGRRAEQRAEIDAVTPIRIPSAPGRTEYCLVDLVPGLAGLAAYPLGAGSGSVRTFSRADGYLRIDQNTEYVAAGSSVRIRALGPRVEPADLIAIGSHCIGLDFLLSRVAGGGWLTKSIPIGSRGGLDALARGEGDVAGTHLLDESSGIYNTPFLPPGVQALFGYGRRQGVVFRRDDPRFAGKDLDTLRAVLTETGVRMVNRNPGSGTRVLIDRLLASGRGEDPPGHSVQVRSHHAVAAAVAQGRADWGVTLDTLANEHGLGFVFVQEERYEIVAREDRRERPAIDALVHAFAENHAGLARLGMQTEPG